MLLKYESYRSVHEKVEAQNVLLDLFEEERPDVVIHLAAQAGVRYSIENPRSYLESNIIGTFELLEAARHLFDSQTICSGPGLWAEFSEATTRLKAAIASVDDLETT